MSMWVLLLFTSDLACENVYLLLTPYSLGFSPSCRILLLLPPNIPLCWAFILYTVVVSGHLLPGQCENILSPQYLSELQTQGHTAVRDVY